MRRFREKPWYPLAVAIVIGVVLYVVLTHLGLILGGIGRLVRFFMPVIMAVVIAYIVNPLSKLYERLIYGKKEEHSKRHKLSNILAFVTFILLLALILFMLIPQLIDSAMFLADNLDSYLAAARELLDKWTILSKIEGLEELLKSSGNLLKKLLELLSKNMTSIISGTASVGKSLFNWLIAFILSIYVIGEKENLRNGLKRLFAALLPDAHYDRFAVFVRKCDVILEQYVTHNFLDSLIVGVINAILMGAFGMPYVGLVTVVVALTNLIPTFGPIIGWIIGAFLLVLIKPWYALAFTIFTFALQSADAYYIKPKLFGDTLGVSGLLILIGIIVGGRMFGVVGILLAIPGVAILDMLYKDFFITKLEARKKAKEDLPVTAEEAADPAPEEK